MSCSKGQWQTFRHLLFRYSKELKPIPYNSLPKTIENLSTEKLQIPIECSRLLFGAALPEHLHNDLNEEECIVITEHGIDSPKGDVIVCRSPSYSPGDVRVLQAKNVNSLNSSQYFVDMENVIFFSTKGKRPDPDKMSGGDLDGDKFLVIWEPKILAFKDKIKCKPQSYDVPVKQPTEDSGNEIQQDWLHYVACWENTLLAEIDSCFFKLASEKGVANYFQMLLTKIRQK